MNRILAFIWLVLACGTLHGQASPDRPDMIVIRPMPKAGAEPSPATPPRSTPEATKVSTDPDRPGFLVIRPRAVAATPGVVPASAFPSPAPNHYGSVTIIRPKPANEMPTPMGGMPSPSSPVGLNAGLPKPQQPTPTDTTLPDPEKGKVTYETWDAIFVKTMHIGYVHTTIREFERDGQKFLYATKELKQTVSRFGQRVEMSEEESTFETADGKVLVYRRKQNVGRTQVLAVTGTVSGKSIVLKGEGQAAAMNESVPWPEGVIGIAKETELMKGRVMKPGETFSYQMFAGQVNWVAKYTITMKGTEKLAIYANEPARELTKVEIAMDPIRDKQGAVFSLPASTVWVDPASGWPVKTEFDMPPLGGLMSVTRTTKDAATRAPGQVPELNDVQSIKLNVPVENIHQAKQVTYLVTAAKDQDPTSIFSRDGRQTADKLDATTKTFEFTVRSGKDKFAPAKAPDEAYLKECLGTSFYIDWDNPETKQHAAAAIARLPMNATALDKAKAVEAWVRTNMRSTEFSQALSSCNTVAKSLSGDCTEYSMLAAGMCRAMGIPARTNLGLVYAPDRSGTPYLAFHMWYEVYADGVWYALDGTLALGHVGPGHVKISEVHWHNETSMAPLLPVLRVLMAKPTVEVKNVVK